MATPPAFTPGTAPSQADLLFGGPGNPAAGAVQQASFQSIPNATWTLVNMDTLDYDNDPTSWTVGAPSRMYNNTPGGYVFLASVSWAANATGSRQAQLRLNSAGSVAGGGIFAINTMNAVGSSAGTYQQFIAIYSTAMPPGYYCELFCYQNSGAALSLNNGGWYGGIGIYKWYINQ